MLEKILSGQSNVKYAGHEQENECVLLNISNLIRNHQIKSWKPNVPAARPANIIPCLCGQTGKMASTAYFLFPKAKFSTQIQNLQFLIYYPLLTNRAHKVDIIALTGL